MKLFSEKTLNDSVSQDALSYKRLLTDSMKFVAGAKVTHKKCKFGTMVEFGSDSEVLPEYGNESQLAISGNCIDELHPAYYHMDHRLKLEL